MKVLIFLFLISLISGQSVEQVESEIRNTEDTQQITNIILKNNKLVEDNIKKFDESSRKKVTAVIMNSMNLTDTTNTTKPKQKKSIDDNSLESNSEKVESIWLFLTGLLFLNL